MWYVDMTQHKHPLQVTDELIPGTPGVCFDAPQAPLMPVVNFHEVKSGGVVRGVGELECMV